MTPRLKPNIRGRLRRKGTLEFRQSIVDQVEEDVVRRVRAWLRRLYHATPVDTGAMQKGWYYVGGRTKRAMQRAGGEFTPATSIIIGNRVTTTGRKRNINYAPIVVSRDDALRAIWREGF